MVSKKLNFSVQDIGDLIEKCSKFGVLQFSYGDLSFSLHNKSNEETDSPISHAPPSPQEIEQASVETMAIDEQRSKKDQLEQMLIENPAEAERLMASGELEDEHNVDSEEY